MSQPRHHVSCVTMEFIRGHKRNALYLVSDGYVYNLLRTLQSSETWQCSQRKGYSCPAQLSTVWHARSVIKRVSSPHTHDPDPHAAANLRIRKDCHDIAKVTDRSVKPREVVNGVSQGFTWDEMASTGQPRHLLDLIRREKYRGEYHTPC